MDREKAMMKNILFIMAALRNKIRWATETKNNKLAFSHPIPE